MAESPGSGSPNNNSTEEQAPSLKERAFSTIAQKDTSNAPVWAVGISAVLATLVSFVLALGLNVGGITDTLINARVQREQTELSIQQQSALATIDLERERMIQENEAIREIIVSLNEAVKHQTAEIALLRSENTSLKNEIFRLQLEIRRLRESYGPDEGPTAFPTATFMPLPTVTPDIAPVEVVTETVQG